MARPVTIYSAQFGDLPFDKFCGMMKSYGYEGIEIAAWGEHLNPKLAATDPKYVEDRLGILKKHGLKSWALGTHIIGQCVADVLDPRHDGFAPSEIAGNHDAIRKWAAQEMIYVAQAAKNMGIKVVTGFMGSPIWPYWYSFPQTTEEMVNEGFKRTADLWNPIFDEYDKCGVRFGLEVHPAEIAHDYYTTERLFEEFKNREALGLNFDPSHLIWQGVTPHIFLRDFAYKVYHVHMKDAAVTLDGKAGILGSFLTFGDNRRGWNFRSLGHGDVDFENIIRELNAMGYDGPLSVEWEDSGMDREFGAKEACEFVKKMNFAPSSAAFDKAMKSD